MDCELQFCQHGRRRAAGDAIESNQGRMADGLRVILEPLRHLGLPYLVRVGAHHWDLNELKPYSALVIPVCLHCSCYTTNCFTSC